MTVAAAGMPPETATELFAWASAMAMIIVAVLAPILGAMADRALDIATRAVDALRPVDHDATDAIRELDAEIDTLEDESLAATWWSGKAAST